MRLCLEKDGLGFQVFNATNDTITLNEPTAKALAKLCPKTPVTREMGEFEAPLSNRKIREVLGFKEAHDWRRYVGSWLRPAGTKACDPRYETAWAPTPLA